MQVDVAIGGRAKAPDQSERAGVGCATSKPGRVTPSLPVVNIHGGFLSRPFSPPAVTLAGVPAPRCQPLSSMVSRLLSALLRRVPHLHGLL